MPPSHPEWAPVCPIPCEARLKVPLLAAIYYHFVGGVSWLCQLVCPWHLSSGHIRVPTGIQRILQIQYNAPYHTGISLCTAGPST